MAPPVLLDSRPLALASPRPLPPDDDVPWFAVWTRSRHEARVLIQLERKGLEAFLPTIARWSRWKDRKKRIDFPLFPGYCFVRVDPRHTLPVLKCAGVVRLVSFEGRPAPVPAAQVESIRSLVTSDLKYDPCPLIHEGDVVEVVSGPLRGVTGRLDRKGARARLVLNVDLVGQAVSVEVDAADVRAA
ncbi:MAG: UpxY family transcription antiterminator [Acidobacteria bacterium]|nr:UpxY family transcription antiterminator [Acidobacteriota bacterium]